MGRVGVAVFTPEPLSALSIVIAVFPSRPADPGRTIAAGAGIISRTVDDVNAYTEGIEL
jgi:hypothetical protein